MKFHVGHIAYPDNSINRFASLNTIHGVYAELWERGVHPRECARVCSEINHAPLTNITGAIVNIGHNVIEVHRLLSDFEIVVERKRAQQRKQEMWQEATKHVVNSVPEFGKAW